MTKRTATDLRAVAMAILQGDDIDTLMEDLTLTEASEVRELMATEVKRQEAEARHMAAWVERERAKGRPEAELTWGNCVRETGILTRGGLRVQ